MKQLLSILIVLLFSVLSYAQNISVSKIEPPNWWAGMKTRNIQLMIYGENLKDISATFTDDRIKIKKINKISNPSYAFIDIEIPRNIKPDNYQLNITRGKERIAVNFPVLKRENDPKRFQGFSGNDVIYLIMPDRFVNGDTSNDSIPGYSDYMNRIPGQNRAGGDIHGMIGKLDYLKELGVTAIWPTPLTENNTFRSYHGYATTDFYKIDPRLGTNELYKTFVKEAHKRNLKIVLDHVSNHFSDDHLWMKNPPTPDWTNGTKENHLDANHHKMIFTDPYADSSTIRHVEQGWFVNSMPDINQANPFVANYIIQNTIWWMEYAGIDAIREDTYPYNSQNFMSRWAKTIMEEFPTTNIVGEVWSGTPAFLAGYQGDTFLPRSFNSNLPAITDFGLRDVLIKYLSGENNLYNVFAILAEDYLYKNPNNLVTFADNHDLPRVMYFAKGSIEKAKILYTILLTTRGIPQIFYGSEIGMIGTDDHGKLRIPFPGGFPNDTRNAFTQEGRTKEENDIYNFLRHLLQLRKTYPALTSGKLTQFPPVNDVYTYFRTLGKETMMIVANNNKSSTFADLHMMKNFVSDKSKLINVRTGDEIKLDPGLKLKIDALRSEIFKVVN